jgi:hypothetical protein
MLVVAHILKVPAFSRLERWLSNEEHLLLLQRIQPQFSASTLQFTTIWLQFQRNQCPLLTSKGTRHACGAEWQVKLWVLVQWEIHSETQPQNTTIKELQRQVDFWVQGQPGLQKSSRTAKATQRNPVLKNKQVYRYVYMHMHAYMLGGYLWKPKKSNLSEL